VVLPSGTDSTSSSPGSKEFLVAMRVSRKSIHSKKTIVENGIYKIPGVTIVSIERPTAHRNATNALISSPTASVVNQLQNEGHAYTTIDPDEPLQDGDIFGLLVTPHQLEIFGRYQVWNHPKRVKSSK
jgi:hypothetical protein